MWNVTTGELSCGASCSTSDEPSFSSEMPSPSVPSMSMSRIQLSTFFVTCRLMFALSAPITATSSPTEPDM